MAVVRLASPGLDIMDIFLVSILAIAVSWLAWHGVVFILAMAVP